MTVSNFLYAGFDDSEYTRHWPGSCQERWDEACFWYPLMLLHTVGKIYDNFSLLSPAYKSETSPTDSARRNRPQLRSKRHDEDDQMCNRRHARGLQIDQWDRDPTFSLKWISTNFPKRLLLLFLTVFAFPKASSKGLAVETEYVKAWMFWSNAPRCSDWESYLQRSAHLYLDLSRRMWLNIWNEPNTISRQRLSLDVYTGSKMNINIQI